MGGQVRGLPHWVLVQRLPLGASPTDNIPFLGLAARPCPKKSHGFSDVPMSGELSSAVSWLSACRITTGFGESGVVLAPEVPVGRGHLALFLYRLAQSPGAWAQDPPWLTTGGH